MKFPAHYMPAKEHCFLVDASQGVEAQTMANFYLAFDQDLTVIPVINKIDMANAQPERVINQIEKLFDFKPAEVLLASGKSGIGMHEILRAIVASAFLHQKATYRHRLKHCFLIHGSMIIAALFV